MYCRILEKHPGDSEVLLALGQAEIKRGNIDKAANSFEQVIATDPGNAFAQQMLSSINKTEQALPHQDQATNSVQTIEFKEFRDRFITEFPSELNAFQMQKGSWKFDYDILSIEEIIKNIYADGRPKFCADTFPGFKDFRIVEVGPSDGYNTAGLEFHGARKIVSVEGNVGAFLRCLIMKNAFNLKTKFLLGDFLQNLHSPETVADLIYASGVLYHLVDPVDFLLRCGEISRNLFIWTFYYDPQVILNHDYEKNCSGQMKTLLKSSRNLNLPTIDAITKWLSYPTKNMQVAYNAMPIGSVMMISSRRFHLQGILLTRSLKMAIQGFQL